MADLYSALVTGESLKPVIKPSSSKYGGRLRRFRAVINMAAATTTTGSGPTRWPSPRPTTCCSAASPPAIRSPSAWMTTVTLGSAVVAIGTNKSHASNGQFRAAATFTATDTPTLFGKASALGGLPTSRPTRPSI